MGLFQIVPHPTKEFVKFVPVQEIVPFHNAMRNSVIKWDYEK